MKIENKRKFHYGGLCLNILAVVAGICMIYGIIGLYMDGEDGMDEPARIATPTDGLIEKAGVK